jgi:hypothetical protein
MDIYIGIIIIIMGFWLVGLVSQAFSIQGYPI